MGAIIEVQGPERYKQIAEDYADIISKRKANGEFKTSLVVAPTHAEIRHVTAAIRDTLKAAGKLGTKEREFTSLRSRNLTEAERTDAHSYQTGEVVQFHQNAKGFKRGERVTVVDAGTAGVNVTRSDGSKALLPFTKPEEIPGLPPGKAGARRRRQAPHHHERITREKHGGGLGRREDRLNNGALYQVEGFTKNGRYQAHQRFRHPEGLRRARRMATSSRRTHPRARRWTYRSSRSAPSPSPPPTGNSSTCPFARTGSRAPLHRRQGRDAGRRAKLLGASLRHGIDGENRSPERKAGKERLYSHVRRAFHRLGASATRRAISSPLMKLTNRERVPAMKDKDDSPSSVLSLSRYVRKPATAPDGDDNEVANAFQEGACAKPRSAHARCHLRRRHD